MGGGGHCRSCIDVIESSNTYRIAGIVEGTHCKPLESVLGYPVLGYDNDLNELKKRFDYALVTVGQTGTSTIRKKLFNLLKSKGFILPAVVAKTAYVSRHAHIGEGSIVMHRAVVNANARIGTNCILNTKSLVEHDALVGDHTHLSTAAVINGGASVGCESFLGSGAVVVQETSLPDRYFFKANRVISGKEDGNKIKEAP